MFIRSELFTNFSGYIYLISNKSSARWADLMPMESVIGPASSVKHMLAFGKKELFVIDKVHGANGTKLLISLSVRMRREFDLISIILWMSDCLIFCLSFFRDISEQMSSDDSLSFSLVFCGNF